MAGRGICKTIPVAGREISRGDRRGNMIPKTGIFSQIALPVMIYLFNYAEFQFFHDNCTMISGDKCHLFCFPCTNFTFGKYSEHIRFPKLINHVTLL